MSYYKMTIDDNLDLIKNIITEYKIDFMFVNKEVTYRHLSNLTIIIPTHNRHNYFNRLFRYYSQFDCDIILCDSTINKYFDTIPGNFNYIHLPETKFIDKMVCAIKNSLKDYILVVADDDFYLKSTILNGYQFLNENGSYTFFTGMFRKYTLAQETIFSRLYANNRSRLIDHQNAQKRSLDLFSNYHMTLWGLYRKDSLKKCYNALESIRPSNNNLYELIIGLVLSIEGSLCISEELFGIREIITDEHWGNRHKTINSYSYYEKDIILIDNYIKRTFNIDIVNRSFSKYISKSKITYYKKIKKQTISVIKFLLKSISHVKN